MLFLLLVQCSLSFFRSFSRTLSILQSIFNINTNFVPCEYCVFSVSSVSSTLLCLSLCDIWPPFDMHSPVSSDDGEIDLEDTGLDRQHYAGDSCRNHQNKVNNKDRLAFSQQESQRLSRGVENIGHIDDNTSQPTHISSLTDAKMEEISADEMDSFSGVSDIGEIEDGEVKDPPSFENKPRELGDESNTRPVPTYRNTICLFLLWSIAY